MNPFSVHRRIYREGPKIGMLIMLILLVIQIGCVSRQESYRQVFDSEYAFHTDVLGIKVHYYDELIAGEGKPQEWLFLHGWVGSWYDYRTLIDELKGRIHSPARLVIPSLPGSGLSQKTGFDYSIDYFVDFLRAFIENVGMSSVNLVGHSMGGHITVWFASRYPEIVENLILIAPGGLKGEEEGWLWLARSGPLVDLGMLLNTRLFIEIALRKNLFYDLETIPTHLVQKLVDSLAVTMLGPGGRSSAAQITRHVLGTQPVDDILQTLELPVLILWGDQDRMLNVHWSSQFLEKLPNAELLILENCGHMPMVEAVEESASAILRFVN